jgi:hypothetical protein
LEGGAEEFLEAGCADFLFGFGGGGFRGSGVVAEIDESGDYIGFSSGGGRGRRLLGLDGYGFELVFQLYYDALGGFAADAGDAGQASQVAPAYGGH